MATLSDLRTYVARDLRDTTNATWSTSELDDRINQGIDALSQFYPKQIVSTFATVSAGVSSYAASSFTNIYRIDTYDGTTYMGTMPHGVGEGPDSGWELHAGVVWMPPTYPVPTGYTLRAFGYGGYIQLSASTQTTDLDTSGIFAVRTFVQVESLAQLIADRAKFQQWQVDSNNTDVTALGLAQLYGGATSRWAREVQRLRTLRKLG
jgi:hypothetical protein